MNAFLTGKLPVEDEKKLKGQFYKNELQLVSMAKGESEIAVIIKSSVYELDELKEKFPFITPMTFDEVVTLSETLDPIRTEDNGAGIVEEVGFRLWFTDKYKKIIKKNSGVKITGNKNILDTSADQLAVIVAGYLAIKNENVNSVSLKASPKNITMTNTNCGAILKKVLNASKE